MFPSRPRNITRSVEARAAPSMREAAKGRPRLQEANNAISKADDSVPGPRTRKDKNRWRRTSLRLTYTASVNRTRTKLSVAMTRRIGDCGSTLIRLRPAGPITAPNPRHTATCGRPLFSITPDKSAEMTITAPTSASVERKSSALKADKPYSRSRPVPFPAAAGITICSWNPS